MNTSDPVDRRHWDEAYVQKGEAGVSWFEETPTVSLDLIKALSGPKDSFIDVGGGASRLAPRRPILPCVAMRKLLDGEAMNEAYAAQVVVELAAMRRAPRTGNSYDEAAICATAQRLVDAPVATCNYLLALAVTAGGMTEGLLAEELGDERDLALVAHSLLMRIVGALEHATGIPASTFDGSGPMFN